MGGREVIIGVVIAVVVLTVIIVPTAIIVPRNMAINRDWTAYKEKFNKSYTSDDIDSKRYDHCFLLCTMAVIFEQNLYKLGLYMTACVVRGIFRRLNVCLNRRLTLFRTD